MAKTAILRARVDPEKKAAAEAVLEEIGLSLSDAISLFLSQVGIQKAIPFPLTALPRLDLSNATPREIEERYAAKIPTPETRAALSENTRKTKRFKSSKQLLKSLKRL
jgi:addiction module RelB/DinJ family antitoxin